MKRNFLLITIILFLLFGAVYSINLFAEEKQAELLTIGSKTQNVYGALGKVDYVEFKSRGESSIVLNTKKGEKIRVSLKELKNEATVLATFRKEKDKKGREKNTLISLSIVKTAKQSKEASKKR